MARQPQNYPPWVAAGPNIQGFPAAYGGPMVPQYMAYNFPDPRAMFISPQQPPPPWSYGYPPYGIPQFSLWPRSIPPQVHVHVNNEKDRHHPRPPGAPIGNNEPGDCWNNAVVAWEQKTLIHNKIGLLVHERYKIVQNIDSGSYGTIFVAEDLLENNHRVAVKFDAASKDDHLKYEYEVYKSALYDNGCVKIEGFPQVYWFGHEYGHNVLVMELLGPPVASLFNFCERKFGLQTILTLGEQMIKRIRHLHQRGFIHRDIKPENFLMGLGENETICYLIDFGLARRYRYREGRQLKHIPFRKGRSFVGTAKYASLNSHKNAELSRRDDVESLGYVLIELINGSLPWKKLKVKNAYSTKHQMYVKIRNMKEQTSWQEVCPSMAEWIQYCKDLPFYDEPDYDHLLNLLRKVPEICSQNMKLTESMQNLSFDDPRCSQCRMQQREIRSKEKKPEKAASSDEEKKQGDQENNMRERKLSKSVSMSVVNSLDPQDSLSTVPPLKPFVDSMSIQDLLLIDPKSKNRSTVPLPDEETSSIASSCRKCRERRQRYFDEKSAATGVKYSWQIWRESTPELKFHYENRFSWTIPRNRQQRQNHVVR